LSRSLRRDSQLRRGGARFEPRRRVLIVCEGDRVEPGYLLGLRRELRLEKERVVILGGGHDTDPRKVLKAALAEHKRQDQSFDAIFCVVDHDNHPGLGQALKTAAQHPMGKARTLRIVVSVPCFEAWLLLHRADYSSAPYLDSRAAKAKMETLLRGYSQLGPALYSRISEGLERAMASARQLDQHHNQAGSDRNPSSDMPLLIEALRDLAKERDIR
jgi:RloB-like protein